MIICYYEDMSFLFLNHNVENCGVYQYGKRLNNILQKDTQLKCIYKEITSYEDYYNVLCENNTINGVIYNYHPSTMWWLNLNNIQRSVVNIGIPHECPYYLFNIVCSLDPSEDPRINMISLPRPIFENVEEIISVNPTSNGNVDSFINSYMDANIHIFGSFGFGFDNKGFDKIVKMVNEQYYNAVIKFVIPIAHFDPDPDTIHKMRESCINANHKPGVILMISHDFFSESDLLKFLKSNTMNMFMYDKMDGRGISSTIDYAMSVNVPIGISDSYMFRNIYSDDICLYKKSIDDCIKNSTTYINNFIEENSNQNVISTFKRLFQSISMI